MLVNGEIEVKSCGAVMGKAGTEAGFRRPTVSLDGECAGNYVVFLKL